MGCVKSLPIRGLRWCSIAEWNAGVCWDAVGAVFCGCGCAPASDYPSTECAKLPIFCGFRRHFLL